MLYSFIDGNGNEYKLTNDTLTYNPMSPELSSTGTYSGGEHFIKNLTGGEIIKLIDVFERALWSEKDHTDKRTMGSGILSKRVGDTSQRVYLYFRSDSLHAINEVIGTIV